MPDTQQDAKVEALWKCTGHFQPMVPLEDANLITGFGIEGDRHATETPARKHRQVLLMDVETQKVFGLEPSQIRENVTVSGLDIHALKRGTKLALGDEVVLEITGFCDPCDFIEGIRDGLREQMNDRRGMLTHVVQGGTLRKGDAIKVLEGVEA